MFADPHYFVSRIQSQYNSINCCVTMAARLQDLETFLVEFLNPLPIINKLLSLFHTQDPISTTPKSSLTSPSSLPSSPTTLPTNSQSTSILFTLPPELRLQIWEEAVGSHTFHLWIDGRWKKENRILGDMHKRLNSRMCDSVSPSCTTRGRKCRDASLPLTGQESVVRKHVLSLQVTCKAM